MTLGNDNGTDGQTDRQTDRRTDRVRRIMRPPPREEGRIISYACIVRERTSSERDRPMCVTSSQLIVVSKSHVTWATSVSILVFLGLSVLGLGLMYPTDRQTSDVKQM